MSFEPSDGNSSSAVKKSLKACPDSCRFCQADEDSDKEVKVLGRVVARRSGKVDATLAEVTIDGTLVTHHMNSKGPMKNRNQHAHQQPGDLYHHRKLNLSFALAAHNQ